MHLKLFFPSLNQDYLIVIVFMIVLLERIIWNDLCSVVMNVNQIGTSIAVTVMLFMIDNVVPGECNMND